MGKIPKNNGQKKVGLLKESTYQDYNKQKPDPKDPNQETEMQGSEVIKANKDREATSETALRSKDNQSNDFFYKFPSMALDNERWTE